MKEKIACQQLNLQLLTKKQDKYNNHCSKRIEYGGFTPYYSDYKWLLFVFALFLDECDVCLLYLRTCIIERNLV